MRIGDGGLPQQKPHKQKEIWLAAAGSKRWNTAGVQHIRRRAQGTGFPRGQLCRLQSATSANIFASTKQKQLITTSAEGQRARHHLETADNRDCRHGPCGGRGCIGRDGGEQGPEAWKQLARTSHDTRCAACTATGGKNIAPQGVHLPKPGGMGLRAGLVREPLAGSKGTCQCAPPGAAVPGIAGRSWAGWSEHGYGPHILSDPLTHPCTHLGPTRRSNTAQSATGLGLGRRNAQVKCGRQTNTWQKIDLRCLFCF